MERSGSAVLIAFVFATLASSVVAQSTTLVSRDSNGVQGDFHSDSPALSADGRYVAFSSQAANLVPGDLNQTEDVFLHDRVTGQTICVSVNPGNLPANGQSASPVISADGRFVAFWSSAWNLVSGNTGSLSDVFLRDMSTGTITRISDGPGGVDGTSFANWPSISGDGHWVGFESFSWNLVPNDVNGASDVFLYDTQSHALQCVSRAPSGSTAAGASYGCAVSSDGSCIAYASGASDLVAGDTNSEHDIFVYELASGTTTLVSNDSNGAASNGDSRTPSLSADGRFVAFESAATNLVAGDTNGKRDVFVHDRATGATTRVSVSSNGLQGHDESTGAHLSGDGRFVVFLSKAANLVPFDTNNRFDEFLHDRATGVTTRVSVDSAGNQGNHICYASAISADGLTIAFSSMSSNLVPNDTNGRRDVFVRERYLRPTAYCTSAVTTNGCAPSIASTGVPHATASSGFTISVNSVEGLKTSIVFYGISGRVASPWASGSTSFLCVKSPTQRTPAQNSGGSLGACDGALAIDWLAYVASNPAALGAPFQMGARVEAQAWFRDPPAPKTTNLSNAIEFDVVP